MKGEWSGSWFKKGLPFFVLMILMHDFWSNHPGSIHLFWSFANIDWGTSKVGLWLSCPLEIAKVKWMILSKLWPKFPLSAMFGQISGHPPFVGHFSDSTVVAGFSRNFVGDMLLPNCGSTQVWTSMKFWSRTPSGVCWTRRIRGNLKDFHSIVIKLSSIWIPGWPMLINLGLCQNLWCHIWVDEHP